MSRLEPVIHGPWSRKSSALDFREEFDGPDYDPGDIVQPLDLIEWGEGKDLLFDVAQHCLARYMVA